MSNEPEETKNTEDSEKKETTYERFGRERQAWRMKIKNQTERMVNIHTLTEVMTDIMSERQVALEYTHTLMSVLAKVNAELRKQKKGKELYYTQGYDLVLKPDVKKLFIDVDLEELVIKQELLSTHLSYMRGTVDTFDKMIYGIKWRLQIKEYEA